LVRFMAQYDWTPDLATEQALKMELPALSELSEHGLTKEFRKLQKRGLLNEALAIMHEYGMVPYLREAWENAKAE